MPEYDNTDSGTLWLESDPKTDKSPQYTGTSNLECPSCHHKYIKRTAGWVKTTKTGKDLISTKYSEPKPRETPTWDETRERFKKDVVLEDITDEVDLSQIPF